MFNLEQAISEWRQQMAAGGLKAPEVLNELEDHLRDDIRALMSDGTPDTQAFRLAVSRLGGADAVSTEFKKVGHASSMPLTIGASLWGGISTALVIGLLTGLFPTKPGLLLVAHVFSLTAGYSAAFLTGGFGIYYVCCRWSRALSPARQQALSRAVWTFSRLSVGLVVAGVLLGMWWNWQNRGRLFSGGPREIGALCAAVWLVAFWLVQRLGRVSRRVTMLLCIIGNLILSLAWFGSGIIAHGNRIENYWAFDALLGVHLFFLAVGAVPVFETAEA